MYFYNEESGKMEYEEITIQDTVADVSGSDGAIDVQIEESTSDNVLLSGDMVDNVIPLNSADASALAVTGLVTDVSNVLVYKANVTGYGECFLVFSAEYDASLTILDGQLLNFGSSNVVGAVYRSDNLSVNAVDTLLVTVLGRSSTNYASNYYRYGGENYVTSYTYNSVGSSLSSSSTYVAISDVEQVTYSNNYWFSAVLLVCFLILAYNGLRRLLNL